MEKVKQRRYRAGGWRKIFGRFEESGLTAQAFCAHERISTRSLRRWQLRLGTDLSDGSPSRRHEPRARRADSSIWAICVRAVHDLKCAWNSAPAWS